MRQIYQEDLTLQQNNNTKTIWNKQISLYFKLNILPYYSHTILNVNTTPHNSLKCTVELERNETAKIKLWV